MPRSALFVRAVAALSLVVAFAVAGPARAQSSLAAGPLPAEATVDVDAASVTGSYAKRVAPRVLAGWGGGIGLSPVFGWYSATGAHFQDTTNVHLLDLMWLQGFARVEVAQWLHLDAGMRVGAFLHVGEDVAGGEFLAAYLFPSVGWGWFWIGPRLSGGVYHEHGVNPAAVLSIDYVVARISFFY